VILELNFCQMIGLCKQRLDDSLKHSIFARMLIDYVRELVAKRFELWFTPNNLD
jgi:hypothetical protein